MQDSPLGAHFALVGAREAPWFTWVPCAAPEAHRESTL